jgi:hypothetical protein
MLQHRSAGPEEYAQFIYEVLTDDQMADYEAFGALCWILRRVHPMYVSTMQLGLTQAISDMAKDKKYDALADAIHIAYQFEIANERMVRLIEDFQENGTVYGQEKVAREVDNFLAQVKQTA